MGPHNGKAEISTLSRGFKSLPSIWLSGCTSDRYTITARDFGSTTVSCPPRPGA